MSNYQRVFPLKERKPEHQTCLLCWRLSKSPRHHLHEDQRPARPTAATYPHGNHGTCMEMLGITTWYFYKASFLTMLFKQMRYSKEHNLRVNIQMRPVRNCIETLKPYLLPPHLPSVPHLSRFRSPESHRSALKRFGRITFGRRHSHHPASSSSPISSPGNLSPVEINPQGLMTLMAKLVSSKAPIHTNC